MHFCNQRKQFAEPSLMLEKSPVKVVTEAKFLGVVFDQTLKYKNRAEYLKKKKKRPQSSGYSKSSTSPTWGQIAKLYFAFIET